MKNRTLAELSKEELQKRLKISKLVTGLLAGMLLFLFVVNTILTIKKGFTASAIVPVALLPILIININSINDLKKEIAGREKINP